MKVLFLAIINKTANVRFEFVSKIALICNSLDFIGRAFHHLGPTTEIDLSAILVLVLDATILIYTVPEHI